MKRISTGAIFAIITLIGVGLIVLLARTPGSNSDLTSKLSLPLRIDEYFDYACPHCQDIQPTMEKIKEDFKDDVVVTYNYYQIFPQAVEAAYAAEASRQQNKFDEYHNALYGEITAQKALGNSDFANFDYDGLARVNGLDEAKFSADRKNPELRAKVDALKAEIDKTKSISGTPTIFVNGIKFSIETGNGSRDFTPTYNKIAGYIKELKEQK